MSLTTDFLESVGYLSLADLVKLQTIIAQRIKTKKEAIILADKLNRAKAPS